MRCEKHVRIDHVVDLTERGAEKHLEILAAQNVLALGIIIDATNRSAFLGIAFC
jgi:hypothetical protein